MSKRTLSVTVRMLIFCFMAAFISLAATAWPDGAACAAERESWLAFERKGVVYGYEHLKMNERGDGKLIYVVERAFKIDVVGMSRQDITESVTLVVDKDLSPVSFEQSSGYKVKTEKISGAVENGKMKVRYDDTCGGVRERVFDAAGVYFDACLPDVILKKAAEKNFSFNIFDLRNIKRADVKVISAEGTVEAEVTIAGSMPELLTVSPDGRIMNSTRAAETLKKVDNGSRQADESVKSKLAFLLNDDSDLTVDIDKPLGNVNRITRAVVAVRWMSIPASDFALEDNRQKVVSTKFENGVYEVKLELTKAAADTAPIAFPPAVSESMDKYISESEYITPADTAVVELAASIAAGETDAVAVVKKLLRWVNDNIETDFIAETLSAPEVLKKKRGKCSENAILFAALARSLKIPAKISLGVMNAGGRWMGHMWNEVYLGGRWIAVDPSPGDFVSGPTHIKFTDSDTVDGTQNVRMKLIDNLGISVEDFEAETAPAGLKTGFDGSVYSSAEYRCRLRLPDKGWTLKEDKKGDIVTVSAKFEGAEGVDFALVMFSAPGGMSSKMILDGRLSALSSMMKDFKKLSDGAAEVAGRKAARARFAYTAGKKKKMALINDNTMLAEDGAGFLFACIAPEGEYEKYEKEFEKIISSFELL